MNHALELDLQSSGTKNSFISKENKFILKVAVTVSDRNASNNSIIEYTSTVKMQH